MAYVLTTSDYITIISGAIGLPALFELIVTRKHSRASEKSTQLELHKTLLDYCSDGFNLQYLTESNFSLLYHRRLPAEIIKHLVLNSQFPTDLIFRYLRSGHYVKISHDGKRIIPENGYTEYKLKKIRYMGYGSYFFFGMTAILLTALELNIKTSQTSLFSRFIPAFMCAVLALLAASLSFSAREALSIIGKELLPISKNAKPICSSTGDEVL